MYLDPGDENLRLLIERAPAGTLVMLNLLRFRDVADYSNHPDLDPGRPISGREAYERYTAHTMPFLVESGGSVEFVGDGGHYFIGPTDERWDQVLLVRQAGIAEFFAFAENQDYLAGLGHREAALEDSRLLPLVPLDTATGER